MTDCIEGLKKDLLFDCDNIPVAGIEKKILLINREDIDIAGSTITGNKITSLVLKSGKTGYLVKDVKNIFDAQSKPIIDAEGFNGHQHILKFRVLNNDAEHFQQIDNLIMGANLVAVVETLQKGVDGKNAFDVLGWHTGLEVTGDSAGKVYKENAGAYYISLGTPEGMKEPRSVYKWLETDYATTKQRFDNKLV